MVWSIHYGVDLTTNRTCEETTYVVLNQVPVSVSSSFILPTASSAKELIDFIFA
jgi:hypothetical protein